MTVFLRGTRNSASIFSRAEKTKTNRTGLSATSSTLNVDGNVNGVVFLYGSEGEVAIFLCCSVLQ